MALKDTISAFARGGPQKLTISNNHWREAPSVARFTIFKGYLKINKKKKKTLFRRSETIFVTKHRKKVD